MLKYLSLFACFFISARVLARQVQHASIVEQDSLFEYNVKRIKDSFATSNIDTFMFYERRCSGCVKGYNKEVFFFWQKEGNVRFFEFSNWSGKSEIKSSYGIFSYFLKNKGSLETEVLDTRLYWFHYDYCIITYSINKTEFYRNVPSYFFVSNEASSIVNLIYMVEYKIHSVPE